MEKFDKNWKHIDERILKLYINIWDYKLTIMEYMRLMKIMELQ